jgi:hypothetical protein
MYSFSDMRLHRPRALARELRRIHRTAENIARASRWSRRRVLWLLTSYPSARI